MQPSMKSAKIKPYGGDRTSAVFTAGVQRNTKINIEDSKKPEGVSRKRGLEET